MTRTADSTWEEFLPILRDRGWGATRDELLRRVAAQQRLGRSADDVEPLLLVLATLQQKFGELKDAATTLRRLTTARDSALRSDAAVRLAKVLSQKGEFQEARETLRRLVDASFIRQRNELPPGMSPNTLWRIGFLEGIAGNARNAQYWLDRHRNSVRHGSQTGNNQVFGNILLLLSGDYHFAAAHDVNARGVDDYLSNDLSVSDVKFLSVAKSVVVPLMLDGAIMLVLRNTFSGLLQLLLCRRLLQLEKIPLVAEGIGEAVACVRRLRLPLADKVLEHWGNPEDEFLSWLGRWLHDERVVKYLVSERERIFAQFVESSDYRDLSIVRLKVSTQRSVKLMPTLRRIFIVHGHDELNFLRLKDFMTRAGCAPVVMADMPGKGQTLIEKFESAASGCDSAVVLFTMDDTVERDGKRSLQARPNVLFEIGWFYGRLGRENVTIAFQRGVTVPSDLDGISRVEFDTNIETVLDRLRGELGI